MKGLKFSHFKTDLAKTVRLRTFLTSKFRAYVKETREGIKIISLVLKDGHKQLIMRKKKRNEPKTERKNKFVI